MNLETKEWMSEWKWKQCLVKIGRNEWASLRMNLKIHVHVDEITFK